ncbi:MAG: transcriptional repressor LexA [Acidobacteria bacterium]|nr:transcriptional repressor LexA [Acidobacteriota bacterium]MCI0620443.1 transcriptional repressor LexA [Acidobacteriota bacterium]MCI0717872.1 transcriptional repressor LexA [Acidobacteriota bacterium]
MELTQKQQEVLDFIQSYFSKQGMAPTVREIAEALGKSAQAIQQHIESLRAKGYLQHQPSKSRTNVPTQPQIYTSEQIKEVPILGRVQAGLPVLAEENLEGTLPLPRDWTKDDPVFLLRVKGDSMKEVILPGDLALVRQQPTAENGEIVVARWHQSDATLKRFYRRANRVVLKAENPKYDPIEATGDEVEVIGKLIGLYRKIV